MKYLFTLILSIALNAAFGQLETVASRKFHEGSSLFINGKPDQALASVNEGLRASPQDEKLQALKKLLEQDKKKQEQQKKEQQKQQQEQQKQEQQQKDQNKNDQNKDKNKDKDQQNDKDKKDDKKSEEEKKKEQEEKEKKEKEQQDQEKEKGKENQDGKENRKKENKELPPEVKQRLKDMNMSEEKAKMILEAMKNQEVQYLQQNKRKATRAKDRSKPDW